MENWALYLIFSIGIAINLNAIKLERSIWIPVLLILLIIPSWIQVLAELLNIKL